MANTSTAPRYNEIILTEEQKQQIIKLYTVDKLSTVKIGKIIGVNRKKVAKVLEENNIARVGNGRRKYSLNETYFDTIDTPNKAYILGFLYADGYNSLDKQTISLSLQEEDKMILEAMRNELNSEKTLEFIDYSNKHDFGYTYKNQYRLIFFSAHMCNSLNSIGMTQNKSLTLEFPAIDPSLYSHFIRGYFDGDGSVCFSAKTGNSIVTITSTNSFCEKIKSIISSTLNIHVGVYDASNKNSITKVASISGTNQVKVFLDYIYNDAELYLERKYKKYEQKYLLADKAA